MNRIASYVLFFLMFSYQISLAQGSGYFRPFGEVDTKFEEARIEEQDLRDLGEFIPVERPVNPDTYILGPGDVLGINIVTAENFLFTLRINPTGDLLIPTVGILRVAGLTLNEAVESIKNFIIENAYRNSVVDVTLVDIRSFRILIVGAIQDPGFVTITAADRLTEVITAAGGLHKYADEDRIKVVKDNGGIQYVSLKNFLLDGDLANNPNFQEGDFVEVPFLENYQSGTEEFMTYNESAVLVTGFVKRPGAFRYFPGYTIRDYIGMAGGVLETGNVKKVRVHRSNREVDIDFNDFARAGDTIYVPENIRSQLFGNISLVQAVSTMTALYLSYLAATRK